MNKNSYPVKQKSRKPNRFVAGALALATAVSLAGDAKASKQHSPHKGGPGQD